MTPITREALTRSFPQLEQISDPALRAVVHDTWELAASSSTLELELEELPISPTLPIGAHGTLAMHIRAMARVGLGLLDAYRTEFGIEMATDELLTAVYVHDVAKLLEFSFVGGRLTAAGGFNHALEGARLAARCDAPASVIEMVRSHSFAGPLVMPRTREAQLFLLLDGICLRAFPEDGDDAIRRHLRSNGWRVPLPPDVPTK